MNDVASVIISPSSEGDVSDYAYLELLARVKQALATGQEVKVPSADIRRYLGQPRETFNRDGILRLSASIHSGGQTSSGMIREKPDAIRYEIVDTGEAIEPCLVEGESRYELIDGERRWRAVGLIPEPRRPLYRAKLIEADDEVIQYLISGITNFNREGHTALEIMRTIDRHLEFGFPMKEVAILLGISEHWAYQIHGLKNLDPDVVKLLNPELPKREQLPVTAAIQISKIDPKFQRELAERVINKDVTLIRLRGEVVKVAQREGLLVRGREVSPLKQWESLGNKIDVLARTAGDAEARVRSESVDRIVRGHSRETSRHLRQLREARETILRIEEFMRRARQ